MSSFDIKKIQEKVDAFVKKYPVIDGPLTQVAEQVKVEKSFIAMGIGALLVVLLFFIAGGAFIVDAVAFAYPLYASLKCIESGDGKDDSQWLTYWLIFSLFKIFDELAAVIIPMIPFYFFIKLGFLVYCYYPATQGATVVYSMILKPYVVPLLGLEHADKQD
mmetsp:Transcript_5297/g.5443  ORF Transcript_5297/g.5443 Transcript_5297/m.5443 type:complete len:162 (+) Transcript_5297:101-586(+)